MRILAASGIIIVLAAATSFLAPTGGAHRARPRIAAPPSGPAPVVPRASAPALVPMPVAVETAPAKPPRLLDDLVSDDAGRRVRALHELRRRGDAAEAREAVEALLARGGRWPTRCALEFIARFKMSEHLDRVAAFLDNPSFATAAADTLRALGEPRAIAPLQAKAADGGLEFQRHVAKVLAELGDTRAIGAFVDRAATVAVEAEDSDERKGAVRELGALGHDAAVPGLAAALADRSAMVRREAARALGGLGSAKALPDLRRALSDPDISVREAAADSIEWIEHPERNPGAIEVLK